MIERAIVDQPRFFLSEYELQKDSPSYSVETIHYFRERYPEHQLLWVLGADQVAQLHLWYQIEQIMEAAQLVAFSRDGAGAQNPNVSRTVAYIQSHEFPVSSTEVRADYRASNGSDNVPVEVDYFIKEQSLYR